MRGLTLPQIKVAVIKHLRNFLTDELLGLEVLADEAAEIPVPERPPIPVLPEDRKPFDQDENDQAGQETSRDEFAEAARQQRGHRRALADRRRPAGAGALGAVRGTGQDPGVGGGNCEIACSSSQIPAGVSGRITITIDVGGPLDLPWSRGPFPSV